jgi:cytoskeleton protein RodZ
MSEIEDIGAPGASVGDRLKTARQAQGLSVDDVAARTRVPKRHIESIEQGDWAALPAPTYSIGFARAYAGAVGLDAAQIGQDLRDQLGPRRRPEQAAPYYEPADPARVPPRSLWLVAGLIAVALMVGYGVWRSTLYDEDETVVATAAEQATPAPRPAPVQGPAAPAAPITGPVVLTATDEVWLRVYEAGGRRLFEGTMTPGQRFEVPQASTSPKILTGRPDAVRVTVGTTEIPPLGPAERTISDVSLLAPDLLARLPGNAPAAAPLNNTQTSPGA